MARTGYATLAVAPQYADALRLFKVDASHAARRSLNTGEALALAVALASRALEGLTVEEVDALLKP